MAQFRIDKCNWFSEFNKKCENDTKKIIDGILNHYYANVDDSRIKIDGLNYNQLCIANDLYVYLTPSIKKNLEAWSNTPLSKFIGVIVKDGADIFDHFGTKQSQCVSHILRYLKGAYDFSKRKSPLRMKKLLTSVNRERNKLIENGETKFSDKAIKDIENKYLMIIEEWKKEFEKDKNSETYKEERQLLKRMELKDKKQILAFIYDFKIPSTNNNAEACQRGLKVKQKIGEFRSESGASNYCVAKSIILTLKKQGKDLFTSINKIFNNEPVLA